jgi:hypothetical protein
VRPLPVVAQASPLGVALGMVHLLQERWGLGVFAVEVRFAAAEGRSNSFRGAAVKLLHPSLVHRVWEGVQAGLERLSEVLQGCS